MTRSKKTRTRPSTKEGYHHGDLRQALLDATLVLVEKRGPQGFTLRAAARAAGVSPGAPYHHFEDKEALIAAVAEDGFGRFGEALRLAAAEPAESLQLRAQNVGVAYVLFAVADPTRFRVMVGYGVQGRMKNGRLMNAALAAYRLVRDVLLEGIGEDASEEAAEAAVLGWWSVVHGLAFLAIDGYLGKAGASIERAEELVRQVIVALDSRKQAGRRKSSRPKRATGRAAQMRIAR